jgi:hypothetical protein
VCVCVCVCVCGIHVCVYSGVDTEVSSLLATLLLAFQLQWYA